MEVANMTDANVLLVLQVVDYGNILSDKQDGFEALHKTVANHQGKIYNLKAWLSHTGSNTRVTKYSAKKQYYKPHQTYLRAPYCCTHGLVTCNG